MSATSPVLLVLGSDPGNRVDATAARYFGDAMVRAARTAGARIVVALTGAVGDAVDVAATTIGHEVVPGGDDVVDLVAGLAGRHRVVVVLMAGDRSAARTLLDPRTAAWSVLAAAHTGGLAGQLVAVRRQSYSAPVVDGDELARLSERSILPFVIDAKPEHGAELEHRVVWELDDHEVVKRILTRRESYNRTAVKLNRNGHRVAVAILLFGVVAVFLAVFDRQTEATGVLHDVFRWILIVLPALVAGLVAFDGVTAASKRWVLIRAACESIKREVFVWRTRSGVYSAAAIAANPAAPSDATELLVDRVASIERQLTNSIASASTAFVRLPDDYAAANAYDDEISRLDASGYLSLRVDDQSTWYRKKIAKLQRQRRIFQVSAILAGATGSILATAGQTLWLPVAFAIGTALGAYAKQRQLDATILGCSQADADLTEIRTRWDARPVSRRTRAAFEQLVGDVETALETEQGNWSAKMMAGLESPLPQYDSLHPAALDKLAERPTMPDAAEIDLPRFESPVVGAPPVVAPVDAPVPAPETPAPTAEAPATPSP